MMTSQDSLRGHTLKGEALKKSLSTITSLACTGCGKHKRLVNMTPEKFNRLNANHQAFSLFGGDGCTGQFKVESTRSHSVAANRLCTYHGGCGNTTKRGHKLCGNHRRSNHRLVLFANPAAL